MSREKSSCCCSGFSFSRLLMAKYFKTQGNGLLLILPFWPAVNHQHREDLGLFFLSVINPLILTARIKAAQGFGCSIPCYSPTARRCWSTPIPPAILCVSVVYRSPVLNPICKLTRTLSIKKMCYFAMYFWAQRTLENIIKTSIARRMSLIRFPSGTRKNFMAVF